MSSTPGGGCLGGGGVFPLRGETWAQCYKTFYHGNLLPFQGNTIILCYKAILPW